MEAYLDGPGRKRAARDLTATLVMKYVERSRPRSPAGKNKIGFMDRFRISRAESGFPVFSECAGTGERSPLRPRKARRPADAGRLKAEMVDFILRNKAFPKELQSRIAERLYLEEAQKGECFRRWCCPKTSAVSVNAESLRPSVVVNWAAFDGAQTLR